MKLRYTLAALAELDEILAYIQERSPKGAHKVQARTADYLVTADGLSLMFEVKELAKDENFRHLGVSSRIVGDQIRSKIKQARDQVRCGANQGIPSILLI